MLIASCLVPCNKLIYYLISWHTFYVVDLDWVCVGAFLFTFSLFLSFAMILLSRYRRTSHAFALLKSNLIIGSFYILRSNTIGSWIGNISLWTLVMPFSICSFPSLFVSFNLFHSLSLFLYPYRPLYLAFVCLYVCSSEQSHWASAHIFKYQILICEW